MLVSRQPLAERDSRTRTGLCYELKRVLQIDPAEIHTARAVTPKQNLDPVARCLKMDRMYRPAHFVCALIGGAIGGLIAYYSTNDVAALSAAVASGTALGIALGGLAGHFVGFLIDKSNE
jgi:hypothetical protein